MYTRGRRNGYGLKYYSYSGDKKNRVAGRIIIVLLCAVILFIASVALGNYLKSRVEAEEAVIEASGVLTENTQNDSLVNSGGSLAVSDIERLKNNESRNAAYFDFTAYTDSGLMTNAFLEVASASYTAVSLPLTETDGTLRYGSGALNKLARLSEASQAVDEGSTDNVTMASVFTVASTMDLYTTGMWYVDSGIFYGDDSRFGITAYVDSLYIAELETLGLDEIMIMNADCTASGVDGETVCRRILDYIGVIRESAPDIAVAIALSPEYYGSAEFAPYVEQILSSADCLAIDLTNISGDGDIFTAVSEACEPLSGSFSLYNLRALIDGTSVESVKSQLDALAYCGIGNWQITTGYASGNTNISDN